MCYKTEALIDEIRAASQQSTLRIPGVLGRRGQKMRLLPSDSVRRGAGGRQQSLPLQELRPFSTRGCGCCVGWFQQPSACIVPGLLQSVPVVRTGAQLLQRRARASTRKALYEIYEICPLQSYC